MKLNSLLSALIFSSLALVLPAQGNNLDFSFSGSESVRNIENNLFYQMSPFPSSTLVINGLSFSEQRMNYSQKSRRALLELGLTLDRRLFAHNFSSGYEYLYDSSKLEEDNQPYSNKTGFLGYALDFLPADSVLVEAGVKAYARTEEDRYLLGNKLASDGYDAFARASVGGEVWSVRTGLSADFEQKELDWEYFRSATLNAYLNHQGEDVSFSNSLNLNQRRDNLYVLGPSEQADGRGQYSLYDKQKRNSLLYSGLVDYAPLEGIQLSLQEVFTHRSIDLRDHVVRNNADYINQASLALNLKPASNLGWNTVASHSYAIKDFNFSQNTRHTENRNLNTTLAWEYLPGDTLSTGASVDLLVTSFPDDAHRWDNDLRNIRLNLGNVHYWKQRLKLSNQLYLNLTDDVYVDGILSGNNKQTTSYIYNPECAVLIGDRMLFSQNYLIRADYTEYVFDQTDKALYRQLNLTYDLVFDSYPYVARSADQRWMLLPYRTQGESAFMADLNFAYERNEYADWDGSLYSINFKNVRYTAGLTMKHDIQDIYYILQPQYSWGTWKEYNLLLGFAWRFTQYSLLEFSLNPSGEIIDDLDWQSNVSLSARF